VTGKLPDQPQPLSVVVYVDGATSQPPGPPCTPVPPQPLDVLDVLPQPIQLPTLLDELAQLPVSLGTTLQALDDVSDELANSADELPQPCA
jgi:hypothetical protein